jgi:hypothetical protein
MGQLQVAPGFGERVPVDDQARVGGRRARDELRHRAPDDRRQHAGDGHVAVAGLGNRHDQPAHHIAQQDGHESAHLHHAVATGQLALAQHLRQVGELDRPEQRGVQPHQEGAQQQHCHRAGEEAVGCDQHDHDLQVLHEADHGGLLHLVRQLPAGGGKQQEGQDEQGTDHQPGHRRRQPVHLQLVGHHHREGELEQVVVGRARKLRPEERRKPALAQQRELVGMLVRRGAVVWTHVGFSW